MPSVPDAWNRAPEPTPEDLASAAFEAPIELLAEVVAGRSHPGHWRPAEPGIPAQFRCPLCGPSAGALNVPLATVDDHWRWSCRRCPGSGTRALLERLVVENPALLLRLGELLRRLELDAMAGGDDAGGDDAA